MRCMTRECVLTAALAAIVGLVGPDRALAAAGNVLTSATFEASKCKVEKTDQGVKLSIDKKTGNWTTRGLASAKVDPAARTATFTVKVVPGTCNIFGIALGSSATTRQAVAVLIRSRTSSAEIQQRDKDTGQPAATDPAPGFKLGKDHQMTLTVDLVNKKIKLAAGKSSAEVDLKVALPSVDSIGVFGVSGNEADELTIEFTNGVYKAD